MVRGNHYCWSYHFGSVWPKWIQSTLMALRNAFSWPAALAWSVADQIKHCILSVTLATRHCFWIRTQRNGAVASATSPKRTKSKWTKHFIRNMRHALILKIWIHRWHWYVSLSIYYSYGINSFRWNIFSPNIWPNNFLPKFIYANAELADGSFGRKIIWPNDFLPKFILA